MKLLTSLALAAATSALAADGNRLTYLDDPSPFWPTPKSAKFTTPQWVGEPGVEAVVVLAIDDMRDAGPTPGSAKYEAFLRPILERLKQIKPANGGDGRAPVSIMTTTVAPGDPQFQAWLKEGLSLEVHTLAHPCPLLGKMSLEDATHTCLGGLDLMASIPNNRPVAFRMPCCDSMNSASPRFFAEIFNRFSPQGRWLAIDSSVFTLPPGERFAKYFPAVLRPPMKKTLGDYAGFIDDYPYPYVIGKLCWEFPCMVPSDWEAFNLLGAKSPTMLEDWKAALDHVVKKQGVFTAVFHPHGWSAPEQWVEFIGYAEKTYGKRVKFLNFREALERLERNALAGQPLRSRGDRFGNEDGSDNGVRLLDVNNDGFMDVVIGNNNVMTTRVWEPSSRWRESETPVIFTTRITAGAQIALGPTFGVLRKDGAASLIAETFGVLGKDGALSLIAEVSKNGGWHFEGNKWHEVPLQRGLNFETQKPASDSFLRLRDFDGDGVCELLVGSHIFSWNEKEQRWQPADFSLPPDCAVLDAQGRDNGLRFADLNGDGFDDVIQSNGGGYAIYLWAGVVKANLGWKRGWPHIVARGPVARLSKVETGAPPVSESRATPATLESRATVLPFVKDGRDFGAWFHRGSIVWQNETTATPEAESVSRTFKEVIAFDIPPPKSPQESLGAMRPRPGFTVELVAAEPLIEGPVNFDWDAQGRLWVVEMRDYPLGMDGNGKPGGVVKILTDTDGDGHYDKATTFLEDLPYPDGIMPWRNGVLIAASADIVFAADTNGDGRADPSTSSGQAQRRVVFTGFKEGNQQHRQNGYTWGLDGWLYGANGGSGGEVRAVSRLSGEAPSSASQLSPLSSQLTSVSGRDFRFRPDTGEFEATSGPAQFGRTRDDWGHWFGNNNGTWIWHYTLEDRYLRRNPKLAVKTTRQDLANYPDSTRVFPQSELPIRFNQPQSVGHVTSGCSPTPYRDELFGPDFATSTFTSEPVHNVVHREVLTPDGATFTSKRAGDEQDREFLASTDPWFRPATLKTGPDGALYIADFYRFVLEHPEWIAPETQSRLDLRAGADKGRIYRIFPTGAKLRAIPNLAKLDNAALAAALDSPNGWQRDTAQRVLTERAAKDAAPALKKLAANAANPKVRVQALATLDTLKALDSETIRAALRDSHPGVRVQSLRVSESANLPDVLPALIACADDSEFTVRHQLALTLGMFRDERAAATLARLAEREGANPQMRVAILSSLAPDSPLFAKLNKAAATAPAPQIVLPKPSTPDRAKVIASYASVAELKGAPARGRELFAQTCSICHKLKNEGHEVGPDLASVFDKPLDWLLTAIFDPNAAIEDRYRAQTLKLKTGVELSGIIATETANNVVLRLPGGTDFPVLRGEIAQQQMSARSLMPEGLETVLKPQDVADLIAWLRAK